MAHVYGTYLLHNHMHLIVLSHGMWGRANDFQYIVDQLRSRGYIRYVSPPRNKGDTRNSQLAAASGIVYCASSNEGYYTYDGIDVCGYRLADEICDVISQLHNKDVKITDLSIVGYSMGGLIARYAIGVLENRGVFSDNGYMDLQKINARVFVTTCSPHVGSNIIQPTISARIFNFIGSWSMARTSRQCFLRDSIKRPLFLQMTQPGTIWVKALARFDRRVLYANIINDRRCDFYTSGVSLDETYAGHDLKRLKGPFATGYEPVVLLNKEPQYEGAGLKTPHQPQEDSGSVSKAKWWILHKISRFIRLNWLAVRVIVVLPTWFLAFLINAGYQNCRSTMRLRNPPSLELEEQLKVSAENVVESIYDTVQDDADDGLQLTPNMRQIIENFNKLGFEKFFLNILTTPMAHAAAIMKLNRPEFYEGIPAVEHLVHSLLA